MHLLPQTTARTEHNDLLLAALTIICFAALGTLSLAG